MCIVYGVHVGVGLLSTDCVLGVCTVTMYKIIKFSGPIIEVHTIYMHMLILG